MTKKENRILKNIRTNRELPLVQFSRMIGISKSYLSMLENGERDLTQEIVNKIIKVLYDLSPMEKNRLNLEVKKNIKNDTKKAQKYVMGLISRFFYYLQKGYEYSKDKLKSLVEEIGSVLKTLSENDWTAEMDLFKKNFASA